MSCHTSHRIRIRYKNQERSHILRYCKLADILHPVLANSFGFSRQWQRDVGVEASNSWGQTTTLPSSGLGFKHDTKWTEYSDFENRYSITYTISQYLCIDIFLRHHLVCSSVKGSMCAVCCYSAACRSTSRRTLIGWRCGSGWNFPAAYYQTSFFFFFLLRLFSAIYSIVA